MIIRNAKVEEQVSDNECVDYDLHDLISGHFDGFSEPVPVGEFDDIANEGANREQSE